MAKWRHLYSRSDVEADWDCPRARYWRTLYGGQGIVPNTDSFDVLFGQTLHHAAEGLLKKGWTVDEAADRTARAAHPSRQRSAA